VRSRQEKVETVRCRQEETQESFGRQDPNRGKRARLSYSPTLSLPITARKTRVNLQDLPLGGVEDRNSRQLAPAHKHLRIGIISNLAPLWRPAASRLGQVHWIAGSSCSGFAVDARTTIHPTIPPDLIGPLLEKDPVDIVFYEGWGPSPSNPVWTCPRVKMVVWLQGRKKFRPPSQGWKRQKWDLRHSDLGGASDALTVVSIASREDLEDCSFQVAKNIVSPLGTATKDTILGVPCRPPEPGEDGSGLALVRLQDLKGRFKLRSVFSKTGWVRRPLRDEEILTVWDVPGDVLRGLQSNQLRALAHNIKVPGKTMSAVVDSIDVWWQRVSTRPLKRILLPTASTPAAPVAKRLKFADRNACPGTQGFQVPNDVLPAACHEREAKDTSKASKNDDAIIPVWLWNDRIAARRSS
jgi:hypothetical protein